MSLSRVLYRVRQFFLAIWAGAGPQDIEPARALLTPAQLALFAALQPSEQAHAASVCRQLVAQGETSPDLLAAALLHDAGKSLSPLRLWERVLIVLARAVVPAQARRWGSLPAIGLKDGYPPSPGYEIRGWRRAFVVAEQHPAWGAGLAAEAGASACTVALIRRHQEPLAAAAETETEVERLLRKLQAVDDHN